MNSPSSRIRRNGIPGRKLHIQQRDRHVSQENNNLLDGRDDSSSAEVRHIKERSERGISSSSSVSSSTSNNRDFSPNDKSMSYATHECERTYNISSSTSVVQKISAKNADLPKTRTTYSDEYLRAALATPGATPYRKAADSPGQFSSQAPLAPSQSNYISDVGRVYDDPPEISSIPTAEIVDFCTRPTIGEPKEESSGVIKVEGPVDEKEKPPVDETTMRGSRDQYTFGRLQARASKRRELLQQVPEEEDMTNYHSSIRASRIKNIRSLYLDTVQEFKVSGPSKQCMIPNAMCSSSNKSTVHGPIRSPTDQALQSSELSVKSIISPSNQLTKKDDSSKLPSHPMGTSTIASPSNQSMRKLSTIEKSAEYPSNHSVANTSITQSLGLKSSVASSNSDELSEYRSKLFAKMLHLLNDVEHPGSHASSTKGSQRSHEYSVAELKLIQQRTEEEMSRILNEFNRSKRHASKTGPETKGPPTPDVMTLGSEVIASKLSDITSPTAYQDGSGVYHDIIDNEDHVADGLPINFPPRPISPRKKKVSAFPIIGGEGCLPIVKETHCTDKTRAMENVNERRLEEYNESERTRKYNIEDSDLLSNKDRISGHSTLLATSLSPQNVTRDKFLASSRSSARRKAKKQHKQIEDRFYSDIMNSVSVAEEEEMRRLNDEVDAFVATFDLADDPNVMNEDGSINEDVASMLLAVEGETPFQSQQLNALAHEQCGCIVQ